MTPITDKLVEAAQAVIDRWDSPLWKDLPHTGEFINRLREALAAYASQQAEPSDARVGAAVKALWNYGIMAFDSFEGRKEIVRAVLQAADAVSAGVVVPGWLPIETAPTARGLYLVQIGDQTHIAQFDPRMASAKWWHPYGIPGRLWQEPTHWMPLAAAPSSEQKEGK